MAESKSSKRKFRQADNGQSSSSWGNREKGGMGIKVEEVVQLNKILAHLEQETHAMKKEMLQDTAEWKTLTNDVYHQLKLAQLSLHPQKPEGGRSDGLTQALYHDWNPWVVFRRGSRAYSVSVKHLIMHR